MLNRRQLLIGAAATGAVLAGPPCSRPLKAADRRVLDSVLKYINACDYDVVANSVINTKLITKYPELFPVERHIFSGPTGYLANQDDERICYWVRTRALRTTYSMELAQDLRSINSMDMEEEFVNLVANELATEIKDYQDRFIGNFNMLSYAPATVMRSVDPNTFQPRMGFKIRYATADKGWRIISSDEERAITMRKEMEYLQRKLV